MKDIILIYCLVMWIISAFVTIIDKVRAVKNKWRIRESTLLILGALGGAGGMFLTMQIIRHKTKHKKFMILLPLFFVIHIIIFAGIMLYYNA